MFSESDLLFRVPEPDDAPVGEGQFLKKIFVLVKSEPGYTAGKPFLEKVLSAVQIDLHKDVVLWSLQDGTDFPFLAELKKKAPEQVLVFGFSPAELHLRVAMDKYAPVFFYGTLFLFADSLSQLEPDRDRKMKLWHALKALFN